MRATLPTLSPFVNALDLNLDERRIFLPAIVPPSAMKPLINREFIGRWGQADQLLKQADVMVVVGYSFNRVDSHFNELFAAASGGKRVAVINPDLEGTKSAVCNLLGIDPNALTKQTINDVEVDCSDSLLFVPSYSQDVNPEMLTKIAIGLVMAWRCSTSSTKPMTHHAGSSSGSAGPTCRWRHWWARADRAVLASIDEATNRRCLPAQIAGGRADTFTSLALDCNPRCQP